MAGDIFISNSITSIGTAFFFILVYLYYENKGIKAILKPIFFIIAVLSIINAWHGQAVAYKVNAMYNERFYIEEFWLVGLIYILYALVLALIIDLAIYVFTKWRLGIK